MYIKRDCLKKDGYLLYSKWVNFLYVFKVYLFDVYIVYFYYK